MYVHNTLLSYLFLLISEVLIINSREYFIKDGSIPSYLYWSKINSTESLFPEDITVNISMSRVTGTFMYCFDRNTNQLIVTLRDGLPHVMDIELNTQRISISLPSICGCDRCRYEVLELRIQLGYYIRVQCNDGEVKMFMNEYKKEINPYYPILYSIKKRSTYPEDTDHMWLVNTPAYDKVYPSMYQLYGCIFDVSYNEKSIKFTEVTPNIDNKCITTCTDNICNGGQCYETYSGAPICNCTSTFLNGPYCNDTIKKLNVEKTDKRLQTESIKLSWKTNSSVEKIFEMKNKHITIKISAVKSTLVLHYNMKRIKNINSQVELSNNYTKNKEYICIIHFHPRQIEILFFNNGQRNDETMPLTVDLRKEIFDSISLRSGKGYIDMVYKDNEEYKWRNLDFFQARVLKDESEINETNKIENIVFRDNMSSITARIREETKTPVWMIVSIVVIVLLAVAVGVIIWYFRCHKRTFT